MKKILVVDDEPVMRKLVSRALGEHYEVVQAASGMEGVELFQREKPDMVLSDLKMPVMSGYEMQRKIQEECSPEVPFIFMTADESDESESKGFEQGAADYIRKPVKMELLLKRIERVFLNVDENSRLRRAAQIDAMTGLYNKATAEELLSDRLRKKSGIFIVADLDSFKLVNDLYGHKMGDKILIRFAGLLKSVLRENDVVGRVGGDEFAAFCEHLTDPSVLAKKAAFMNDEILRAAKEYMGPEMEIPLGCSVGAAYVPEGPAEYGIVFQKADAALYRVKQGGKHGSALYEEEGGPAESGETGGFYDLRTIFGERNEGRGAFVTDVDTFRGIYRFLDRFSSDHSWEIWMVLFTFIGDSTEEVSRACDQFLGLSAEILRRSDVLLRYGSDRVLLLLPDTDGKTYPVPLERVLSRWEREGSRAVSVGCMTGPLRGGEGKPFARSGEIG